jgi:TolB protein
MLIAIPAFVVAACSTAPATSTPATGSPPISAASPAPSGSTPRPTRIVHDGVASVVTGQPIELGELSGRIVFDDFEDVFAMDVDGSNVVTVAGGPGPEFDGAWSPDGEWIVYRDSTRGLNVDDEIYVARADGSDRRNLTVHPANDWGPDWSPDGEWIAFNSDRAGGVQGWLVRPDGTDLQPMPMDGWVEYPSFSPDGLRVAYMSAIGNNYEIMIGDLQTGATTRLTSTPGSDGWPAWSPDGTRIAFKTDRDDCARAPRDAECWDNGDDDTHHDIWLVDTDGSDLRRVTPEHGQFVAWSPDGRYLLVSGRALYVVRPDGTGRLELRGEGFPLPLGGIPDWR